MQLFLEAAENGNVDAQFNLGTRYFEGRYGIRDFDKAEEWLTKAKNNGASDAVIFLSKLDDERQRIKEKQNGLIEIHAYDLLSEYIGNEINADAKFKSKILEIHGEVFSVSKGLTGGYYVILSDGFNATFRQIQCFFDEKEVSALQQLQAGYAAVIRGRCEGLMGNIILKDCIVIAR